MSASSLLAVENLTICFGERAVVDRLSFAVKSGEIVALVGESGSGKTMAARAVIGLPPYGAEISGDGITFRGRTLDPADPNAMRCLRGRHIGMIFQEPMTSLDPSMTVGEQMMEGLRLHFRDDSATCRQKCVTMLERVRIANAEAVLDSYPHQFSGGMRQRISIATAMLMQPELIIADEPTTALDVLVQREVLDLLVEIAREENTGVLLITHDLGIVAQYADRVVVMRGGQLVETADTDALFADPRMPYTQALLSALPRRDARAVRAKPAAELLHIENLSVRFRRGGVLPWKQGVESRAVDGVTLSVRGGEMVAIVGESGSGKSTLVRSVLRLVDIHSGDISFDGCDVRAMSASELAAYRRRVRIVFQDPMSALNPRMRVGDIVGEGLRHEKGLTSRDRKARVERMLGEVGLGDGFSTRFPHHLSGGQRQRVNIARALVAEPELLIADEPVSALDLTVQAEILRLLSSLQASRGFACLFISHALGVVEQIADRVVVINRGRIVEVGNRDDIFERPGHPYTQALLNAAPRICKDDGMAYRLSPYRLRENPPPHGYRYSEWKNEIGAEVPVLLDVGSGHRVACTPLLAEGTG